MKYVQMFTFLKKADQIFRYMYSFSNIYLYALGLKGPPGHLVIRSSVRLSVRPSIIPPHLHLQYLKFGWSYNNHTWTVSSSKGCSPFTDIACPWRWGGVKIWDQEILSYFDFVAAGGIRVSQTHVLFSLELCNPCETYILTSMTEISINLLWKQLDK